MRSQRNEKSAGQARHAWSERGPWVVVLVLLAFIVVPFALWGEWFGAFLNWQGTCELLEKNRSWAWFLGIGLLISDLFLPIPGTVVMSALGWIYGPILGGLSAAAGSFLSAHVAYELSRAIGRPIAERLAGEEGLNEAAAWFSRRCGPAVAFSRCLPVLNEAVACLAGMSLFSRREFAWAALLGSVPVGFSFAWIGHLGRENSDAALLLSVLTPLVLWFLYRRTVRHPQG